MKFEYRQELAKFTKAVNTMQYDNTTNTLIATDTIRYDPRSRITPQDKMYYALLGFVRQDCFWYKLPAGWTVKEWKNRMRTYRRGLKEDMDIEFMLYGHKQ